MAIIGELAVNIVARTKQLSAGLRKTRTELGGIRKGFGDVTKSIRAFSSIGLGIGGGLSIAGFAASIKESSERIDQLAKTSQKLGISTQALAGLQVAADRTGVEVRKLETGLQRMVRRVAEAAQGTGEARNAIAELGLDAKRLNALSPDQQFQEIATAMQGISQQSDKVRLAFKLFDAEGVDLLRTLSVGATGLEDFRKEAEKLGLAVSADEAAKVEKFNDAISALRQSFQGLSSRILISLAPGVSETIEGLLIAIDRASGGPEQRGAAQRQGRTITRGAQEGLIPNIGPALERAFTNLFFGGFGGQNAAGLTDRERQRQAAANRQVIDELRQQRRIQLQQLALMSQQQPTEIVAIP
jgi:hypothetical protein